MHSSTIFTEVGFYSITLFFFLFVVLVYKRASRWHATLTLFLGLITAFIDVQSSEVSFTVLLLLAFGFFLGFARPLHSLRTALLLAVWVPFAAFASMVLFYKGDMIAPEGLGSFVAFVPAFIGTSLGAFIRKQSDVSPQDDILPS